MLLLSITLKARLYVSLDIACFTYNFATPFKLAVTIFSLLDGRLDVTSPTAELVTTIGSRGANIALAPFGAERSCLHVGAAEIGRLLGVDDIFLSRSLYVRTFRHKIVTIII